MKNPTIDDLMILVYNTLDVSNNGITTYQAGKVAKAIHALYNPVRKPLSELALDQESCKEIATIYWPSFKDDITISRYPQTGETVLSIHKDNLHIYDTGEMEIDIEGVCCPVSSFCLADKIRELGYDFTPEKNEPQSEN